MEKETTTGIVIWIVVVAVFVFERSIQHDFKSRAHDIPMYGLLVLMNMVVVVVVVMFFGKGSLHQALTWLVVPLSCSGLNHLGIAVV
jgi:uncharacterized membrane protein YhaH (DUF805 family)